jgi:hypothetical protein
VLDLVAEKQEKIDAATSRYAGSRPSSPFYYLDQDVWNAVLASSVDPGELVVKSADFAPHPPFTGSQEYEPFLLHHIDRKPWLESTRTNAYSRMLPRLLLGPNVTLRLQPDEVPLRLREGRLAAVERARAEAAALAHGLRGRVGLRRRFAERRRRA